VLAVGAYQRTGHQLERIARVLVEVAGERTPLELPPADLYLLNDDDLTFASTRPDAKTRDAFFGNAADLPTPISRAVAVATAWDMLITGEATAGEVVRCLTGVVAAETSESLIEPHLNRAVDAALLWSSEPELAARVAATCRRLVGDARLKKMALRGFASTAADLDAVGWLQTEAADDVDLQWRALVRKAQLGGDTAAEADALLARDRDPEAWISRLTVRAATPDALEKQAVWHCVAVDHAVPLSTVYQVMAAFWSAGQEVLLRPFAAAYLELVPSIAEGGMMPARTYAKWLFPLFGVDEAVVEKAKALVVGAEPVVRAGVLERADLVTRMLRARRA
jgi:aminopeptidase N